MTEEPGQSSNVPGTRRAVLPYQRVIPTSPVTIRTFREVYEAQLFANELAAHGIDSYLLNQNTNDVLGAYVGFTAVDLQVRKEDAEQASAVLATLEINPLEVEPAEIADPEQLMPHPDGEGMLTTAAAYDNPRSLFDAAATLGAARIESFLPMMAARGDRPAGQGNRFILRVGEEDADQARQILSRAAQEDADDGEPRCPKCGSYRVMPVPQLRANLIDFIFGPRKPKLMECLRCHNRWTP